MGTRATTSKDVGCWARLPFSSCSGSSAPARSKKAALRGGAAAARKSASGKAPASCSERTKKVKKLAVRKKAARKSYSGSSTTPGRLSCGRHVLSGPCSTGKTPEEALRELLKAGYLTLPDFCVTCKHAVLEAPFRRKDVSTDSLLYVRCKKLGLPDAITCPTLC